jgi:argininosuccinate synthase
MTGNQRVVLAFSGGSDGVDAIRTLSADRDVVTLTLDVGQGHELTGVRERALASGAVRAHVLDVREELARVYFWPAVEAGRLALSSPGDLLAPLFAAKLVELARIEDASAVAHEWTGSDADRVAEAVCRVAPDLTVLAPLAAEKKSAADEATLWSSARLTANDAFELTRDAASAPSEGASVDVTFTDGTPSSLNGIEMSLVETIESVETLAGAHGIGRVPLADGAWIEAPAAVVLRIAYEALRASAPAAHGGLNGTVSLRLRQGACAIVSCTTDERRLTASTEPS